MALMSDSVCSGGRDKATLEIPANVALCWSFVQCNQSIVVGVEMLQSIVTKLVDNKAVICFNDIFFCI